MAITLKQQRKYENELSTLSELKSAILSAAKAAAKIKPENASDQRIDPAFKVILP